MSTAFVPVNFQYVKNTDLARSQKNKFSSYSHDTFFKANFETEERTLEENF